MIQAAFWFLAVVSILGALSCITRTNPVASALCLVLTLFGLAGMFALLDAHFLAVLQIIVYAGAIMVLFLFVIMLLNAGRPGTAGDMRGTAGKLTAVVMGGALVAELFALRGLVPGDSFRL